MSNATTSNLESLVQIERLRQVRAWLVGLGMVVILFSLTFVGGSGISPKWWGNTFAALREQGFLLWLVIPGVGVGLSLLVAAAVATLFLRKKERNLP